MELQPGDTAALTMDFLGWDEKVFETTGFTFDVAGGALVTRLEQRETAAAIYDWSQGEAIDYDPAPNTNLPDPFNVSAVTGLSYNSRQTDTQAGDQLYTLQLEWDPHPDAFVQENGSFESQYKLSTESDSGWLPGGPPIPGRETKSDVVNSSVNIEYDLRIRSINNLGVF